MALDRFASDLLPPRACLFIAHDEVLIVDTREMKVKLPSVYCRLPHQTGVTERSISGDYRGASHHVLNQMMVGHLPYRICRRLAVALHGHHDVSVSYESSLTRLCISLHSQAD